MGPTKKCTKCLTVKETSEFNIRGSRPSGEIKYNSECKRCNAVRTLAYYHSNPEYRERNAFSSADSKTRKTYGISYMEYLGRLISQGFDCAICGNHMTNPQLDHCHTTGKVRDFLCIHCNRMLGWANDDPEYLRKMARYLEKHEEPPED